MGLLSGIARMARGGGRAAMGSAQGGDNFVLGGMRGLDETTPPDIAQRIRAFQSADARGMSGGLSGGPAQFHMKKEILAQQLSGGDPQIMNIIRQARDESELEQIAGMLRQQQSSGGFGGF